MTQGTSTNAAGNYEITAPAGATLLYGYAGCLDQTRSATLGTMNIVLQPTYPEPESRRRR
jgi:hypothetical protein